MIYFRQISFCFHFFLLANLKNFSLIEVFCFLTSNLSLGSKTQLFIFVVCYWRHFITFLSIFISNCSEREYRLVTWKYIMEVVLSPGRFGDETPGVPFQKEEIREWSHVDRLTGMLERARVETGRWQTSNQGAAKSYGKVHNFTIFMNVRDMKE